jgi:hypothetical protein
VDVTTGEVDGKRTSGNAATGPDRHPIIVNPGLENRRAFPHRSAANVDHGLSSRERRLKEIRGGKMRVGVCRNGSAGFPHNKSRPP